MDTTSLMELDDIQSAMVRSIGMISVIADGLDTYTYANTLSGDHAAAYVNTLYSARDTLADLIKEFGEALARANPNTQKEVTA